MTVSFSPFSPTHLLGYCEQSEERCRKQTCPRQLPDLGQCARKPWFPLWREVTGEGGGNLAMAFLASSPHDVSFIAVWLSNVTVTDSKMSAHHANYAAGRSLFKIRAGRTGPAPSALPDPPHLSAHVSPAHCPPWSAVRETGLQKKWRAAPSLFYHYCFATWPLPFSHTAWKQKLFFKKQGNIADRSCLIVVEGPSALRILLTNKSSQLPCGIFLDCLQKPSLLKMAGSMIGKPLGEETVSLVLSSTPQYLLRDFVLSRKSLILDWCYSYKITK